MNLQKQCIINIKTGFLYMYGMYRKQIQYAGGPDFGPFEKTLNNRSFPKTTQTIQSEIFPDVNRNLRNISRVYEIHFPMGSNNSKLSCFVPQHRPHVLSQFFFT